MREAFQILLEKLCCFGIGGIAVFLFVRATLPSVSSQIVTPVRDAVRKRRVCMIPRSKRCEHQHQVHQRNG